jgi:hypothetical protein
MKTIALVFGMAVMLDAAVSMAKDVCAASGAKHFDDGLVYHLARANVPYLRKDPGLVCVDEKHTKKLVAAEAELENYFHEIAIVPLDDCGERALIEWAQKEGLRYEVDRTFDAQRRPIGKLLFVRSFTYEQLQSNREKLKAAPERVKCGT